MKVLLHTCCAPCLIFPADKLAEQGHELTTFYYNPNIHPFSEFDRRRDAYLRYCRTQNLAVIEDVYDFENYLRQVTFHEDERCRICYRMRMMKTAEIAAFHGFAAFSTTLLVSPYQKHEDLAEAGRKAAACHGVDFLYQDWRDGFRTGRAKARELGIYTQKYCGCVYSEAERFSQDID